MGCNKVIYVLFQNIKKIPVFAKVYFSYRTIGLVSFNISDRLGFTRQHYFDVK